jgi:cytochrome d ubiquinol oxidase subunit I
VGYVIQNGLAELSSFFEVVTNPYGWNAFFHTVTGSWALAGFFVIGVSAWHLLRKQHVDFFAKSFRVAAGFALVSTLLVAAVGHRQGNIVAEVQPAKLAAMESHWETQKNAPMYLFAVPDPANEKNSVEIGAIPSLLSLMAFNDPAAEVRASRTSRPRTVRPSRSPSPPSASWWAWARPCWSWPSWPLLPATIPRKPPTSS